MHVPLRCTFHFHRELFHCLTEGISLSQEEFKYDLIVLKANGDSRAQRAMGHWSTEEGIRVHTQALPSLHAVHPGPPCTTRGGRNGIADLTCTHVLASWVQFGGSLECRLSLPSLEASAKPLQTSVSTCPCLEGPQARWGRR